METQTDWDNLSKLLFTYAPLLTSTAAVLIAFCSVIVASSSFWLTFWQARQTRRHNRLSVKPYLSTRRSKDLPKREYGLYLDNSGLGPAKIDSYQVFLDGRIVPSGADCRSMEHAVTKVFDLNKTNITAADLTDDMMIPSKDERPLLLVKYLPSLEHEDIRDLAERIHVKIEYSSMYGEKFHVETDYSVD